MIVISYYYSSNLQKKYSVKALIMEVNDNVLDKYIGFNIRNVGEYFEIFNFSLFDNFQETSLDKVYLEMGQKTILGLDIGASIGRELTLDGRIFPIGASRIKVVVDNSNSAYLGLTTSPYNADGDLVFGLVYGVGMRF